MVDSRLLDAINAGNRSAALGDMPEENIIKSLAQGAYRNLTLPEDVRTGRVDPLSDGGIIRALELGSSVGLGNIPKVTRGRMVESNSLVDDYFKNKNKSAPELSHEDFGKQVREFQADDDLYTQKPFEFDNELPTLEQLDAIMKELNPGIGDKAVEVPSYYKGWPKTGEEYVNMGEQLNADEKAGKISIVDSIKRASELAKYYQDNIASKKSVDITGPISDYKTPSGQLDWDYRPRRARRLTFEDQFVGPPDPRRELPGDPISRAMEQGYKGPLYTGVNSTAADAPVYGFSDPRGGDKWSESGIFLTDRPDIAENYAHKGMTIPVMARMENPKVVDMGGKQYENHWMDKHIEDAIKAGHDSMIINNMRDLGGEQTQYVILEPNRLRSPWANFDPMLKDSRNLLSGTAAGAVGVDKLLEWINQDKENRM